MQREKLILLGAGGHCKACIDVIEETDEYEIIGVLDHPDLFGTKILSTEVIGTDDDILKYVQKGYSFLVTVGQIKSATTRINIFDKLNTASARLATVISPKASVSRYATIGAGTIVMHHVNVSADVQVGMNCILNTGCDVEHESTIGNHTHVSTFAVVNGACTVGDEVFIGSNATLNNQVNVANNIIIGSGSVVRKDLKRFGTYFGDPARIIR